MTQSERLKKAKQKVAQAFRPLTVSEGIDSQRYVRKLMEAKYKKKLGRALTKALNSYDKTKTKAKEGK